MVSKEVSFSAIFRKVGDEVIDDVVLIACVSRYGVRLVSRRTEEVCKKGFIGKIRRKE